MAGKKVFPIEGPIAAWLSTVPAGRVRASIATQILGRMTPQAYWTFAQVPRFSGFSLASTYAAMMWTELQQVLLFLRSGSS